MTTRNVYLDCEFLPAITATRGLVSIGLTDDQGVDYYAVNADMDVAALQAVPWMVNNVWPYLPRIVFGMDDHCGILNTDDPAVLPIEEIRAGVTAYFNNTRASETRLYAYYGGQDIARLHSLWDNDWAAMPDRIPRWFTELEGLIVDAGRPRMPEQESGEHHALADARYNRVMHEALAKGLRRRGAFEISLGPREDRS
ncbi:hypothetical protein [Streptomyces lydicus]|uniref:hypothetical protein n=1 Tax=Streptomyces lydicus TaxID=47763 RepID=UPI00378810A2